MNLRFCCRKNQNIRLVSMSFAGSVLVALFHCCGNRSRQVIFDIIKAVIIRTCDNLIRQRTVAHFHGITATFNHKHRRGRRFFGFTINARKILAKPCCVERCRGDNHL